MFAYFCNGSHGQMPARNRMLNLTARRRSLKVGLHVSNVPAERDILFQFTITSFRTFHYILSRCGKGNQQDKWQREDLSCWLIILRAQCGKGRQIVFWTNVQDPLFIFRLHACSHMATAVSGGWVVWWWDVCGWIKTSRLKPQVVQPCLIP